MRRHKHSLKKLVPYFFVLSLLAACSTGVAPGGDDESTDSVALVGSNSPVDVLSNALAHENIGLNLSRADSGEGVTIVPLSGAAGNIAYIMDDEGVRSALLTLFTFEGETLEQWPVCHVPPGNPSNAHTIFVGQPAVKTHLDKHGDTVGYCENDPDAAKAGVTSISVTRGLTPAFVLSTYEKGELVIAEAGDSAGTRTLEELLTDKPLLEDLEDEAPRSAVRELADYARAMLGDYATGILEVIPGSMGGEGAELKSRDRSNLSSPNFLQPQGPSGPCGINNDECEEDDPEEGDPEAPEEPGDGGEPTGTEGEGEPEGGSGDGNDGSDSDDDDPDEDDGPSGPSYDEGELDRLKDEVEFWEDEVERLGGEVEDLGQEIEWDTEGAERYIDIAREKIESRDLPEIEKDLIDAHGDVEAAKQSYRTATGSSNLATVAGARSCTKGDMGGCGVAVGGLELATESRVNAVERVFEGREEMRELREQRDEIIGSINADIRDANEFLRRAEEKTEELGRVVGELETASDNLGEAREDLREFKDKHDIP